MSEDKPIPTMASADVIEVQPEPYKQELAFSITFLIWFIAASTLAMPSALVLLPRLPGGLPGLLLFAALVYGLTTIVVISEISWPFRRLLGDVPVIGPKLYRWAEPEPTGLLACPLCTSTWLGAILSVLGFRVFPVLDPIDVIGHGLVAAGIVWLLHGIAKKLGLED